MKIPSWLLLALALCSPAAKATSTATIGEAPTPSETEPEAARWVQGSLTVRVTDREAAAKAVIQAAEARNGWFSELSDDRVTVRVPAEEVRALMDEARALGRAVDRGYQSTDLTAELAEQRGRLKAREEVLERYMKVLESASPKAVVSVEREITSLVADIEQVKGRIRLIEDQAAFGKATISFEFRERRAPSRDGSSSFRWLNSLNVADLLSDLSQGRRATRSRSKPTAPDGFAPWKKRGRYQAVSPDEVAYRVRSVRNKPTADLDFWTEATLTRMALAGYRLVHNDKVEASGERGSLMEFAAANGTSDQTYLIVLFERGRHLVLIEASGESDRYNRHRDAILAAVQRTGW